MENKKKKFYILSEEELIPLIEQAHIGFALEGGGVDNWSFYNESIIDYCDECGAETIDELVKMYLNGFTEVKEIEIGVDSIFAKV